MKRLISLAVLIAAVGAVPAHAGGGATTYTATFHRQEVTSVMEAPCADPPELATVTVIENGVFHTTVLANGTSHMRMTFAGTFTAVRPSGTYTGHFSFSLGENENRQNSTSTFTFTIVGESATGETVNAHLLVHVNTSASEPPHLTFFVQLNGAGDVVRAV